MVPAPKPQSSHQIARKYRNLKNFFLNLKSTIFVVQVSPRVSRISSVRDDPQLCTRNPCRPICPCWCPQHKQRQLRRTSVNVPQSLIPYRPTHPQPPDPLTNTQPGYDFQIETDSKYKSQRLDNI
jgi:hypothetical protein